jgi:DNA-binding response OmpR family regulator
VRRIRISSRVPIILLTARRNVADKIVGLDAGADDYVTKPYELEELLARIRAQLRRAAGVAAGSALGEGVRAVGGLVIDTPAHRVTRDGKPVYLSAREFDVLRVLSEAPGRVVDRKTIFARIWGPDFYGEEGVLDVYIRRIRAKIEPNASAPSYLHTVRGVGYRLEFEPPGT